MGEQELIQYNDPVCCGNIEGPNAIAVLPDDTLLISDLLGKRLPKNVLQGVRVAAVDTRLTWEAINAMLV